MLLLCNGYVWASKKACFTTATADCMHEIGQPNPKMTSSACTSDNLWYYYYSVCQTNFEEINRIKYIDAIGREVIKRTGTTRLLLWTVQCWRLSVCYFFQRPSHHHHHSHKLKFKAQLSTIWPNKIYYELCHHNVDDDDDELALM